MKSGVKASGVKGPSRSSTPSRAGSTASKASKTSSSSSSSTKPKTGTAVKKTSTASKGSTIRSGSSSSSSASSLAAVANGDGRNLAQLLTQVKTGTSDEKRLAARSIAQKACVNNGAGEATFRKEGGIEGLVTLCKAQDSEVQYCGVVAFGTMARKSDENKARIVAAGALKPLVTLINESPDDSVRNAAASGLASLGVVDDIKAKIIDAGGLEAVLHLTKTGNEDGQIYAMGALANLSTHEATKDRLLKIGVGDIISLMSSSNNEVQRLAAAVVGNLANKTELQTLVVKKGGVKPLIKMAESANMQTKRQSVVTLANLAAMNEENQKAIVQSGALAPLVALLESDDEQIQIRVAAVISNLGTSPENRQVIADMGGLKPLIKLLKSKNPEVQYRSCAALANLAQNNHNKSLIAEFGGIKLLLNLLSSSNSNIQCVAAAALGGLAMANPANQETIVKEGGMKPIVKLTTSQVEVVQRHAARLLAALAMNDANRLAIVEANAVDCVCHMVHSPNHEVLHCAVATIAHLTQKEENKVEIVKQGGVKAIMHILTKKGVDTDILLYVVWALANLATLEENRPRIRAYKVEGPLKELAKCGDLMIQCEAGRALMTLELIEDNKQVVRKTASVKKPKSSAEYEIDYKDITLGERIGMGGFGEVYRGKYKGADVAVKKLLKQEMSDDDLEDFHAEISLMNKLSHENVLKFLGACTQKNNMCMLTEFVSRGSLCSLLRNPHEKVSFKMLVDMAIDAARGMTYLHAFKPAVIHRDLKTENLLVDSSYHIKVADFGISRVKSSSYTMTQCGTPKYMAPEVLKNEKYDEKADVYSFGMVMWEMLSREEPYPDLHPVVAGMKIAYKNLRPKIPDGHNKDFVQLIEECWDQKPKRRPLFPEVLPRLEKLKKSLG